MKRLPIVSLLLLSLSAFIAHAQHTFAMHTHSGTAGNSVCVAGRYDGPIALYPPEQRGNLYHKVSTGNEDAQKFFNQGLTFFYGFDAESAMRSFNQAAKIDPNLAMANWGIALAAGGDLNIPINDPCMTLARAQMALAFQKISYASKPEQDYIDALAYRYAAHPGHTNDDPFLDPQQLSVHYMLAMKSLYNASGINDPDLASLYAYSLMNLRPWLWWTTSGKASEEIKAAIFVLEAGLRDPRFKNHIGLNHIYIHAMEEGPIALAPRAKPSADFLFNNAPFITPHLNHMPAHTYLLLGDWQQVVAANTKAIQADQPWAAACAPNPSAQSCNALLVGHYYSHDMLFLDVALGNFGRWEAVRDLSNKLEANALTFVGNEPGLEHYLTTRVMMTAHFGRWNDLAAIAPPQPDMPALTDPQFCAKLKFKLTGSIWYFGQAMAHASLGKPTDDDVYGFKQVQGCVQGAGIGWGNNAGIDILNVVHWRMLERIARSKNELESATQYALLAVETEDLLDYDEPPGWYVSSRETYGSALFLGGFPSKALSVFNEDLARRPNNSRSLFGRWKALEAIGSGDAPQAKKDFYTYWDANAPLPKMEDM
jgi:hypothetical protein